jgi:acetyl-CoA synthetase
MGSPAVATPAARFSGPSLGIAADVVNADGASVTGEEGELVIRRSWPGMTRGFWKEPQRYLDTYWSAIPGTWVHGDRAIRYPDGSWELPGRSDDVLKIAGRRIGPSELESVASEVPGVALVGAVGLPHATKGAALVLAVTAAEGTNDTAATLAQAVEDRMVQAMGAAMRPSGVLVVEALPLTRSGKVHRRVLRAWLAGVEPGDLSSLQNPEIGAGIATAGEALRESMAAPRP